ncbi:hypothetical protein V5O48_006571 [Marasmius crinis-equi]|uniref:Uncharacterized protein n=1 Tax=Marasmius crinis-equi TaxID=585013 RepID=A0ABR3FJZ9_9AGAR
MLGFRTLRSGRSYPLSAGVSFLDLVHNASSQTSAPPLSLEDDLGPDPMPLEGYLEAIAEDGSDDESFQGIVTGALEGDDVLAGSAPKQSLRNSKRAAKRKRQTARKKPYTSPTPPTYAEVVGKSAPITVELPAEDFDAAKGAHTGKRGPSVKSGRRERPYTLSELVATLGFIHVKWDGLTPHPISDPSGRVIAALIGRPQDQSYFQALCRLLELMLRTGLSLPPPSVHRRGVFRAYNMGVAMGMGSPKPVNLIVSDVEHLLKPLLDSEGIKRIVGFHNAAFALWAPRLHAEYRRTLKATLEKEPHLKPPFSNSVFSACTFNFGPRTQTFRHRDFFNWPFGWCFITALGRFDHRTGGQLVLWDLKLVIDFPHGSTIALPSAVVTHSNLPIARGEVRTSFTQYSAGPIFRWVENDFMTQDTLKTVNPAKYRSMMAGKTTAYQERVKLFSTLEELGVRPVEKGELFT